MSKISTINLYTQSLYEKLSDRVKQRFDSMTWEEKQQANQLLKAKKQLPKCLKSPSQSSINIILEYSEKTSQLDAIL